MTDQTTTNAEGTDSDKRAVRKCLVMYLSIDTVYCEHDAVECVNSLIIFPKHIGCGYHFQLIVLTHHLTCGSVTTSSTGGSEGEETVPPISPV